MCKSRLQQAWSAPCPAVSFTAATAPHPVVALLLFCDAERAKLYTGGPPLLLSALSWWQPQAAWPPALTMHVSRNDAFCRFNEHLLQLFTFYLFLSRAAAAMPSTGCPSPSIHVFGQRDNSDSRHEAPQHQHGHVDGQRDGTVLVTLAINMSMLVLGRLMPGVGVGFATQAAPLYLSEVAPYNMRGTLNITCLLAVMMLHIIAASLDVMFSAPSMLQGAISDKCHQTLDGICEAVRISVSIKIPWHTITGRRYWPQVIICILLPTFQQLTGIDAVMFHAPQLLDSWVHVCGHHPGGPCKMEGKLAGSLCDSLRCSASYWGGRCSSRGASRCSSARWWLGLLIMRNFEAPGNDALASGIIALLCLYVAGFAWSWGPLGWLVPTEIHPLERAAGTAINTFFNFLIHKASWRWSRVVAGAPFEEMDSGMDALASTHQGLAKVVPSLMAQKPSMTAVILAMQPGVPLDASDLQVKYGLPKPDGAAAAGR
ncbi:hypothetical protein COO60DRAFT_1626305 [Scenedesmus sp. NREL 46B-D3]|nr:hypothetical protein COO60DRAFT_1626305 [Scenedesmus sp. NREL 46B-D3]